MAKYIIREQIPCYVDFYREVDVMDGEDPLMAENRQMGDYLGHRVGDELAFVDPTAYGVVDSLPSEGFHPAFPYPRDA